MSFSSIEVFMNRREFIKSTGTLLAASSFSSLLPMLARAAESNDQYLLMYEMAGGWDVSLSLDPWLARDKRRILLVFVTIIITNIILVSPVTQARYRFPAEPFMWVAAVYTGVTLWNRYRRA
jgi:hypothetical protein